MHILHVTLGFYPAEGWGGPVKSVHRTCAELVRRGHKVTIYCTNLLNKKEKIRPGTFERNIDGIRVVYFDTWNLPWWPGTVGPFWMPGLPNQLKQEISEFDVVHLQGYRSPMFIPAAIAARKANLPIITQPRGTLPVIVNSLWVKRLYDQFLGRLELDGISALIALQESERQQALAQHVPAERIHIIPNGIDLREREKLPPKGSFRQKWQLPPELPLILFLGRINKKKGTDMLVEAFAHMEGVSARLAIVGPDDGQLAEVQQLIKQYHLEDRVFLPGVLSGPDVLGAFQDADLFVLPCRTDTFPNVLIESCLVGTPMVITEGCEIAHLVRDRVADVVPFDAKLFSDAMKHLLTDRERWQTYHAASEAVMRDTFSIEAVVDRVEALYRQVIAEKNKG